VDPRLVTRGRGRRAKRLWWADDSPLIDELYDAIEERGEAGDEEDEGS
jgi:hypothetical protein